MSFLNGPYVQHKLARGNPLTAAEKVEWAYNQPIHTEEEHMNPQSVSEVPPTVQRPVDRLVELDDMAKDLDDLALVEKMLAEWEARKEEIRTRIKDRLGEDGVGTVRGVPVFAYRVTAGFAKSQFAKDHPGLAAQFSTSRVVQELNADMLAQHLPDLYAQYRVRQLKPVGSQK